MLELVLTGARAALKTNDPVEMEKALQALNTAIAELKEKLVNEVDKTALNEAVVVANGLNESEFTSESFGKVKDAVTAAQTLPANADQATIDAAVTAVYNAIAALVPSSQETTGKNELTITIATAEAIDKEKYTEESISALEFVLSGAKAALNTNDPVEMEKAIHALNTALAGLKEKDVDDKNPFLDVKNGAFYYDAVLWAVEHDPQITKGTDATHFSPDATCTRGQVVTFLWRAVGSPEPTMTFNPFSDVKESAFYYKAVLWALQNSITNGIDSTHFGPDQGCTRAQVVTFLWRTEHQPKPSSDTNPFVDVTGGYYYSAVLWAVEKGITKGTSADKFSPDATCTRGQIVTFLYRDMK